MTISCYQKTPDSCKRTYMGYDHNDETAKPDAMIFFRVNAPACGLFGYPPRRQEDYAKARDDGLPNVDQFESDFVTYLDRLSFGKSEALELRHLGDEFAHC